MITDFAGEYVPEDMGMVSNFEGEYVPEDMGMVTDFMGEIADFSGEDEDGDLEDLLGAIADFQNDPEMMGVITDFGLSPELMGDIAEMEDSEVAEILPELMGGRLRRALKRMRARIRARRKSRQARRISRVAKRNPARAARIRKRINRRQRRRKKIGRFFKKMVSVAMPLPMRIKYLRKISGGRFKKRRRARRARRQARRTGRKMRRQARRGGFPSGSTVKKKRTIETEIIPPGQTRGGYTPEQEPVQAQSYSQPEQVPQQITEAPEAVSDLTPGTKKAGLGKMMPIVLIGAGLFLMKDLFIKPKAKVKK